MQKNVFDDIKNSKKKRNDENRQIYLELRMIMIVSTPKKNTVGRLARSSLKQKKKLYNRQDNKKTNNTLKFIIC